MSWLTDILKPVRSVVDEAKAQVESDRLTIRGKDGETAVRAQSAGSLPDWVIYAGATVGVLYLLKKRKRKRK